MHPAAWIIWASCASVVTMATTNPFYLIPVIASAWAVHATQGRTSANSRAFRVFVIFAMATVVTRTLLVFVVPSSVGVGTIAAAALEGLRLATLLIVFGAFNSVSDPFGVLKLAPRRFHEPALAAALALSIAPRTIETARRVREAQRLRGIAVRGLRSLTALAVPVLETGMEQAVTLAESMDARGHGRGRRSRYRPETWQRSDLAVVAVAFVATALFVVASVNGEPSLTVSTFPLRWPTVSATLAAACLLVAAPAFVPVREP